MALFVKLLSRVWSKTSASSNCLVRSSMPGAVFSSAGVAGNMLDVELLEGVVDPA